MADAFPVTEAQIVGLFVECIAYGMYLVSLVYCMAVLLFQGDGLKIKPKREIRWPMVAATLAMAILGTLDVAFALLNNLNAFVFYTGPGGPTGAFHRITNWVSVMRSVCYIMQTTIGDGMLIYRLYMVYTKKINVIILPTLVWLAHIATSWVGIWIELDSVNNALLSEKRLRPTLYALFTFTLTINLIATPLIVLRLWNIRSSVAGIALNGDRLARVARIVLDSGAVYTACVIVLFAVNIAGNNALYPVSDLVMQVIGITFNVIIIRVDRARNVEDTEGDTAVELTSPVAVRLPLSGGKDVAATPETSFAITGKGGDESNEASFCKSRSSLVPV